MAKRLSQLNIDIYSYKPNKIKTYIDFWVWAICMQFNMLTCLIFYFKLIICRTKCENSMVHHTRLKKKWGLDSPLTTTYAKLWRERIALWYMLLYLLYVCESHVSAVSWPGKIRNRINKVCYLYCMMDGFCGWNSIILTTQKPKFHNSQDPSFMTTQKIQTNRTKKKSHANGRRFFALRFHIIACW